MYLFAVSGLLSVDGDDKHAVGAESRQATEGEADVLGGSGNRHGRAQRPTGRVSNWLAPVRAAQGATAASGHTVAVAQPDAAEGGPSPGPRSAAPGERARAPIVVTRLNGKQRTFPVGMMIRIGRDPEFELTSLSPLVSRRHAVLLSDEHGATFRDESRRGTFLNGKRVHGPLRITHSVILRLGDPATGEELGITPPLTGAQLARNRRKAMSGRLMLAVAATAVIVAAVALGTWLLPSHAASRPPSLPTVLSHAEAATVRLLIGAPGSSSGWGSGTLISPDGLILTNAHVAEPQAQGAAVAAGLPASQLPANPPFLTVELTTGPASNVVARYRARPVAVDGYLDLAVVRIYATSSGQQVSPASLHLPHVTLGSDAGLQLDQPVTVLGFPGSSGSSSITVTSGVISTFVPDPLGHVPDPRFELETTARVAHGDSGGAAISNAGQLIGVPSLTVPGEGSDVSWRLRSVTEAGPLIAAVRNGVPYRSSLLVQPAVSEQVTAAGVGSTAAQACTGAPASAVAGPTSVVFGASYTGFPRGLDIALIIRLPDGTVVPGQASGLPQGRATASSGCFSYSLDAGQLGLPTVPDGTYQVQLAAGPNLAPVGTATEVVISHVPSSGPPGPGMQ